MCATYLLLATKCFFMIVSLSTCIEAVRNGEPDLLHDHPMDTMSQNDIRFLGEWWNVNVHVDTHGGGGGAISGTITGAMQYYRK